MANREKVIKALEKCRICECDDCTEEHASHCPWDCIAYDELVGKALALLKEQETELSYRNAKAITHTATKLDDATCPSCGNVIRLIYDYCHYCGQKLDWEGR